MWPGCRSGSSLYIYRVYYYPPPGAREKAGRRQSTGLMQRVCNAPLKELPATLPSTHLTHANSLHTATAVPHIPRQSQTAQAGVAPTHYLFFLLTLGRAFLFHLAARPTPYGACARQKGNSKRKMLHSTFNTQFPPRAACVGCHIFMGNPPGLAQTVLGCWLPRRADECHAPLSRVGRSARGGAEDRARQRGQRPRRGQRPVGGQRAEEGDIAQTVLAAVASR